jgi:hypothetical protein
MSQVTEAMQTIDIFEVELAGSGHNEGIFRNHHFPVHSYTNIQSINSSVHAVGLYNYQCPVSPAGVRDRICGLWYAHHYLSVCVSKLCCSDANPFDTGYPSKQAIFEMHPDGKILGPRLALPERVSPTAGSVLAMLSVFRRLNARREEHNFPMELQLLVVDFCSYAPFVGPVGDCLRWRQQAQNRICDLLPQAKLDVVTTITIARSDTTVFSYWQPPSEYDMMCIL